MPSTLSEIGVFLSSVYPAKLSPLVTPSSSNQKRLHSYGSSPRGRNQDYERILRFFSQGKLCMRCDYLGLKTDTCHPYEVLGCRVSDTQTRKHLIHLIRPRLVTLTSSRAHVTKEIAKCSRCRDCRRYIALATIRLMFAVSVTLIKPEQIIRLLGLSTLHFKPKTLSALLQIVRSPVICISVGQVGLGLRKCVTLKSGWGFRI